MRKHALGPWEAVDNNWEVSSVYDAGGNLIAQCRINGDVDEENQDEFEAIKEANAHLIASAPEMLEALKRMVKSYDGMEDGNGDPCPDVAHAKSVIAKAEGGAA